MNEELIARSVLDEQIIKSYLVSSATEIGEAMSIARCAASAWDKTDPKQRVIKLAQLEAIILAELDNITEVIMAATGKVKTEVILGEIYPVLALLRLFPYIPHRCYFLKPMPRLNAALMGWWR